MIKKSVLAIITSLVFAGGIFAIVTHAQTAILTSEQLTIISQNCLASQTELQRIQHNDTATRVNRGQGYESLITRLITPLNSRATSGGYNNSATVLVATTNRYQLALNNFKNHYRDYDNALSSALKIKCKNKPSQFYDYLQEARKQRQNLASDTDEISRLIDEYRSGVIKLKGEVR